jgi:hypothetical protein
VGRSAGAVGGKVPTFQPHALAALAAARCCVLMPPRPALGLIRCFAVLQSWSRRIGRRWGTARPSRKARHQRRSRTGAAAGATAGVAPGAAGGVEGAAVEAFSVPPPTCCQQMAARCQHRRPLHPRRPPQVSLRLMRAPSSRCQTAGAHPLLHIAPSARRPATAALARCWAGGVAAPAAAVAAAVRAHLRRPPAWLPHRQSRHWDLGSSRQKLLVPRRQPSSLPRRRRPPPLLPSQLNSLAPAIPQPRPTSERPHRRAARPAIPAALHSRPRWVAPRRAAGAVGGGGAAVGRPPALTAAVARLMLQAEGGQSHHAVPHSPPVPRPPPRIRVHPPSPRRPSRLRRLSRATVGPRHRMARPRRAPAISLQGRARAAAAPPLPAGLAATLGAAAAGGRVPCPRGASHLGAAALLRPLRPASRGLLLQARHRKPARETPPPGPIMSRGHAASLPQLAVALMSVN